MKKTMSCGIALNRRWMLTGFCGLMLGGIGTGAMTNLRGQSGATPAPATTPAVKPAEEVFKNIQVLKGIPSNQIFLTMQFITASLGVNCDFCHVNNAGEFEKDDKPNKATARKMIAMQMAINKENFKGRAEVTCYSCHRGSNEPVGIPLAAGVPLRPTVVATADPTSTAPKVTPEQVLEKYTQAVGGADALQKFTSRIQKGTVDFAGSSFPVEIITKAPDKRMSIVRRANRETLSVINGSSGWLNGPGLPAAAELTPPEVEVSRLSADFYFAVHPKQSLGLVRIGLPEKIGDRNMIFLLARREGTPPVKLYFDEESGLLVRMVRYTETPLGRIPVQQDFSDYRDTGGVKLPYRWTELRPNGRATIQINEVEQNAPVDDARFVMPAAPPPPKPPSQ